jgi:hypothetical protein
MGVWGIRNIGLELMLSIAYGFVNSLHKANWSNALWVHAYMALIGGWKQHFIPYLIGDKPLVFGKHVLMPG